jgi:2-haloacid dehalogenase
MQALVFDAYGTLFDVFSVTALCEEMFPGKGAALAQVWRAKQLQYSLLRSLMGRYVDFWTITGDALAYGCASLGIDQTADPRARLMDAYLRLAPFPDTIPALQALRARGLRLAILSNGSPRMLDAAVVSAGLDGLFDAVISVDALGVYKPSPAVYALPGARLSLPSASIGFVSSNGWDVAGATSAGLRAIWVRRASTDPAEVLGTDAAGSVLSLTDLLAVVDGERGL